MSKWAQIKTDPVRLARKRELAKVAARRHYEKRHPGCPAYRPTGRPGGPKGARGQRPGTEAKRAVRAAERAELKLRKQRAQWLFLANQIPGCLTPARCKTGHWVRPEEIAGTSRMCRPCRRAKAKEQRQKNPLSYRARHRSAKHRRRARERGAEGDCTPEQWVSILTEWGHACAHCSTTGVEMTRDHIIPLSKGGSNDWTNYQPLCHPCNSKKCNTLTGAVQACLPGMLTFLG